MSEQFLFKGAYLPLKTISDQTGINYSTLRNRVLIRRWSIEKATSVGVRIHSKPSGEAKKCAKCKETKPLELFHKQIQKSGTYRYGYCLECVNRDNVRAIQQKRLICLTHYSQNGEIKCALCPEKRIEVLDFDHIHGRTPGDRKHARTQPHLTRFLIKNNFPPGYRILCRNCNWIEHLRVRKMGPYWEYQPLKPINLPQPENSSPI